ncbi:Crp/Fnr family transcriptional regulator [Olsenella profusa]|uniref:Cyclic nucleotide-binding domain protein n=1 Tax=Olsenella profusa F0195 TaxID=1125712 RepID=U2V7Q5_9ACTN|nr:Crp/Fnr family transcriptional regulator [Olsenella profusa]ERL08661.1 cyclic nucleotide-binding domain protein [Olsenella profusa F0195]
MAQGMTDGHLDTRYLDSIPLFAALPTETHTRLMRGAHQSTYPRGSVIAHEGDPIDAVLIVREGRIKTFHVNVDGEEHVLDVLHDGQAVWHGLFLPDHTYHYSVGCLTRVSLSSIRRQEFEGALLAHPEGALKLVHILSGELDAAEEKLMMLGVRDPRQRLADYLLHRDARCLGGEIDLKLEDIARSINLRPETVSRTFTSFEHDGLVVRLGRGRLKVLDHAALRDVSA